MYKIIHPILAPELEHYTGCLVSLACFALAVNNSNDACYLISSVHHNGQHCL